MPEKRNIKLSRASMTVELSLLMPFVLSVIILLIYLSAFLYNRETAQSIACIGLHKGLQMEHDTKAAVQKKVEDYMRRELSQRLLLHPDAESRVEVGRTKIRITVTLEQNLPFPGLSVLLRANHGFQMEAVSQADRLDPAKIMWVMKK